MAQLSKQDLAIMNAEMAARIFMHIAQAQITPSRGAAKTHELSEAEQVALREMFGPSDSSVDHDATRHPGPSTT